MAVTVDGTSDILGIWDGDGGEGAKALKPVYTAPSEDAALTFID